MIHSSLIKKLLVATDGSEPSLHAALYAAEIAGCTGAEVTILNAAEISGVTQFVSYSIGSGKGSPLDVRRTGESIIEMTKKPFLEAGVSVRTKIVEGYAAEVILSEAEEGKYDLIAMGSRGAGTGTLKRMFLGLGSVAERVLANAPCPVLAVRT